MAIDVIVTWLVGIVTFSAAVAVLFVIITTGARRLLGPSRRLERELGLEVLARRLARGEITQAEHDDARRALGAR